MIKDRLIAELCDFGVVYSLFVLSGVSPEQGGALLKISWEDSSSGELRTHSCVFELDLDKNELKARGRKGNQLSAEHFCAERICAWARRELQDYARAS